MSRLDLGISDGAEGCVRAEGLLEVEHDERADAHHRHDLKRLLHLVFTRECHFGVRSRLLHVGANHLGEYSRRIF